MSEGVGEDDLSFSPKQLRGVAGLSNHIRGFRRPLFPVKILQFVCGCNGLLDWAVFYPKDFASIAICPTCSL
jgi:hypothetical protein